MQSMTQRDPLITKNYIWAHQKINFLDRFFLRKVRLIEFPLNWKIELAKNKEYDSAWCANQEKLYLSTSKNQFLRPKSFGQKLRLKKFLRNWKIELGKNAEYDSASCSNHEKLYLSKSKNQFLTSKFFGQKLR